MEVNKLIRWWMTPKLPVEHIFIDKESRPKEVNNLLRVYLRKWVIHPIKRRIAKYYLVFLKRFFDLKVIAITGSAGKTTTKEMVAFLLTQLGETVWSIKNIDPVYNIPTSIINCLPSTKFLVVEMGVEYVGEMDYYLWLAKPDIALITNVYPTHTEFFQNIKGVAKEKSKLVKSMKRDSVAILNINSKYLRILKEKAKAKVVYFGKGTKYYADNIAIDRKMNSKFTLHHGKNKINIHLKLIGKHFIENSLAASCVGSILGANMPQIKKGLEEFTPEPHRMKIITKGNLTIVDDSYNNNPKAAEVTIDTFNQIAKNNKKIIIFGDMLELGKLEKKYHQQIGKMIGDSKISLLIGVGAASKDTVVEAEKILPKGSCFWVEDQKKVDKILKPHLVGKAYVLIKGSRSIGLDNLVSRL